MDQSRDTAEGRDKEIRIGIENVLYEVRSYYIFIKRLLLSSEMLFKILTIFIKRAIDIAGGIAYKQVR